MSENDLDATFQEIHASSRYEYARKLLYQIERYFPKDVTQEERDAAFFSAYPWNERKYYPYKIWCKALKDHKRDMKKLRTFSG
jgi:hypothetical protein